jgi:hypothetical protein
MKRLLGAAILFLVAECGLIFSCGLHMNRKSLTYLPLGKIR